MMFNRKIALVVLGVLLFSETTYTYSQVENGLESFKMSALTTDDVLNNPYDLMMGSNGWLWVSERWGNRIVRIQKETGEFDLLLSGGDQFRRFYGMVLDPHFGTLNQWLYVAAVTNDDFRIVRLTYTEDSNSDGALIDPIPVLTGLPKTEDHISGRLLFGADEKLYMTYGDLFANHASRQCFEIQAQSLPSTSEIASGDFSLYVGKVLRVNKDGSIPDDNPLINGVQSHIFSYGHRNPQGMVIGPNGYIYSSEHGPATDDEVNLIQAGQNYGWPNIAGFKDDINYFYCNRSSNPDCGNESFDILTCPDGAQRISESEWDEDFTSPMVSLFVVEDAAELNNDCSIEFICRPGIAPSNLTFYDQGESGIPGWGQSLMVASLKTGSVYRLLLNADGESVIGNPIRYFNTVNRYRDVIVAADNKSFYVLSDDRNATQTLDGSESTTNLANPGTILYFEWIDPLLNTQLDSTICEGQVIEFGEIEISETGDYEQVFTAVNGEDSTVSMKVHVIDTPVIDLGPDLELLAGTVLELAVPTDYVTYKWSTGENTPSIRFEALEAGTYILSVQVTNANGCVGMDEISIFVLDPLSLNPSVKWNVHPNPAQSTFSIEGIQDVKEVSMLNMSGKEVKSWTPSISYDVSDTLPGVYLLIIDERFMTKIIIE